MKAAHPAGHLNSIADHLSRVKIQHTEWSSTYNQVLNQIFSYWGKPVIDLFASKWNHKAQIYWFLIPDQRALAINRCIVNFVGQDDSIFISRNMSYSWNFVTHEAISVSNNSHSATVVKEALVHRSIADANRHTNETSSKGRSVNSTKGKHLASRSKDFQSNGMASININFKNKGFSKETR